MILRFNTLDLETHAKAWATDDYQLKSRPGGTPFMVGFPKNIEIKCHNDYLFLYNRIEHTLYKKMRK
jgi:hypothetical protein